MFHDRTDRSDADSLSQTGTDKAEVTFYPIPKMPVRVLIFNGLCVRVFVGLCNTTIMCLCVCCFMVFEPINLQCVCTDNRGVGQLDVLTVYSVCMHVCVCVLCVGGWVFVWNGVYEISVFRLVSLFPFHRVDKTSRLSIRPTVSVI